jgi:hypothetical protein
VRARCLRRFPKTGCIGLGKKTFTPHRGKAGGATQ